MAVDEKHETDEAQQEQDESDQESSLPARVEGEAEPEGAVAKPLSSTRYVHAGFLAAAIMVAYVFGQAFAAGFAKLADAQWAVDKAPWLTRLGEEERSVWATLGGALIALGALVYVYRRPDIRAWVNDAAAELAKVTWPSKKEVTRNTAIVIIASLVATFYLALLDRFWGFVTNLVYGI